GLAVMVERGIRAPYPGPGRAEAFFAPSPRRSEPLRDPLHDGWPDDGLHCAGLAAPAVIQARKLDEVDILEHELLAHEAQSLGHPVLAAPIQEPGARHGPKLLVPVEVVEPPPQ